MTHLRGRVWGDQGQVLCQATGFFRRFESSNDNDMTKNEMVDFLKILR
jgi:hypothetical protein